MLSKPTRRTDPVSDEIRRLVGIAEKRESSDEDIAYAFSLLWLEGVFLILIMKSTMGDAKNTSTSLWHTSIA